MLKKQWFPQRDVKVLVLKMNMYKNSQISIVNNNNK